VGESILNKIHLKSLLSGFVCVLLISSELENLLLLTPLLQPTTTTTTITTTTTTTKKTNDFNEISEIFFKERLVLIASC
jgi:hypothetical protein